MRDNGKPMGRKSYGSIPHVHGSRLGPGDHHIHWGNQRILTEKLRDKHDRIIVTEKMDGSCTCVANVDGEIVALGRAGWLAQSSPYEQHHLFAEWVRREQGRFDWLLPGQRLCGEWMAQAHGTQYDIKRDPWFVFDLIEGKTRLPFKDVWKWCEPVGLQVVPLIHDGGPLSLVRADQMLGRYGHGGATDHAEGFVYRCERRGVFDFMAKFVREEKVPGVYLPEISGDKSVWNWRPSNTGCS